jgi:prepilin-type N-terminal cleavage/methylation domain-containing protein
LDLSSDFFVAQNSRARCGARKPYFMARSARRLWRDHGFTLVELLVVILVIAVLIAVAAPSFLGQTHKATDSRDQQYLTVAYQDAAAAATDYQGNFGGPSHGLVAATKIATAIGDSEPGLVAVAGYCPPDAGFTGGHPVPTSDPTFIVVSEEATGGGDLELCNDPTHKVWTLTVLDHVLQPFQPNVEDGSGVGAPYNTTAPIWSGTDQVGYTLTSTTGGWANYPTSYAYQWQTSTNGTVWTDATGLGATTDSYTVAVADSGKLIQICVTAANAGGASTVCSPPAAGAAADSTPTSATPPVLSDPDQSPSDGSVVVVGDTLSVSQGGWQSCDAPTPCDYTYTWQRAANAGFTGTLVTLAGPSSTATSYAVASTDEGGYIRVSVEASNLETATSAFSNQTAQVLPVPPANDTAPAVSPAGTPQVGQTVEASAGSWTSQDTLSYAYQWYDCADDTSSPPTNCAPIAGAAGAWTDAPSSAYVVQVADVGQYLRVEITATDAFAQSTTAYSDATPQVISAVPVGAVVPYAGASIPAGWLLADGSAVSRVTYSDLFAVEGTSLGAGDGSTTFNLPDLRGRLPLGKAASGTGSTLGSSGGALGATGTIDLGSFPYSFSWTDHPGNPSDFQAVGFSWSGAGWASAYCCGSGTYTNFIPPITFSANESGSTGQVNLSASGSADVQAQYSTTPPPFRVVRYIVKADASAGAPSCALWSYAGASAPSGTAPADGTSGSSLSCLNSAFSALPDLRGAFPVGQGSGLSANLDASGGSLSQTATVSYVSGTGSASVTLPSAASWQVQLTISDPSPGTGALSYSTSSCYAGAQNGNYCYLRVESDGVYGFTSISSISAGSDNGYSNLYSSPATIPGTSVSTINGPSDSKTSSSYTAPYLALSILAYTGAGYSPSAGTVSPYAGASGPNGWLLADGACYATSVYPALFAVIGYTYGGSGGSFCVPDLRGRSVLGTASAPGSSQSSGLDATPTATLSGWTPGLPLPQRNFTWQPPARTYSITGGATNNKCCNVSGVDSSGSGTNSYNSSSNQAPAVHSSISAQTINGTAIGSQLVTLPAQNPPFQVLNFIIKY